MKVQICSKSLLKEETYAHGKIGVSSEEYSYHPMPMHGRIAAI